MIENNLLHFENDSTFQTEKTNIKEDSITFVKDSKKVYTHNKEYNMVNWGNLSIVAGDICLYDSVNNKKVIAKADKWNTTDYPAERYTPIGVVAVPPSHTDDGTTRIISLAAMDYNNPDNGNTEDNIGMAWGGYKSDISTLKDCQYSPLIKTGGSSGEFPKEQTIQYWFDGDHYLSSDYFNDGYQNPYDTATCYGSTSSSFSPSPYLNDGSKNPLYSQVYVYDYNGRGNKAEEMDGRINTAAILAIDNEASTDWQTATTIINNTSTSTQPHTAAQCCWRYHTIGTNQGDWYLPAGGELGYLASRWKAINTSIDKIRSEGFQALSLPVASDWWSSTKCSSLFAVYLSFYGGSSSLGLYYKDQYYPHVRAFLAV